MAEEFHGVLSEDGTVVAAWKQFYGWNTINTNIWLPSLSELVGYRADMFIEYTGCYASAMQNIPNITDTNDNVDKNGGEQWAWLLGFNQNGGAAEIWQLCGNTTAWLRSPDKAQSEFIWAVTSDTMISWGCHVTATRAVHPAAGCRAAFR